MYHDNFINLLHIVLKIFEKIKIVLIFCSSVYIYICISMKLVYILSMASTAPIINLRRPSLDYKVFMYELLSEPFLTSFAATLNSAKM